MQLTFDPLNADERAAVSAYLSSFVPARQVDAQPGMGYAAPATEPAASSVPAKAKAEKVKPVEPAPSPAPSPVAATLAVPATVDTGVAAAPAAEATIDDARKALIAVGDKLGAKIGAEAARGQVVALLAEVGAQTIKQVKPEDFGTIVARSAATLAEHGV